MQDIDGAPLSGAPPFCRLCGTKNRPGSKKTKMELVALSAFAPVAENCDIGSDEIKDIFREPRPFAKESSIPEELWLCPSCRGHINVIQKGEKSESTRQRTAEAHKRAFQKSMEFTEKHLLRLQHAVLRDPNQCALCEAMKKGSKAPPGRTESSSSRAPSRAFILGEMFHNENRYKYAKRLGSTFGLPYAVVSSLMAAYKTSPICSLHSNRIRHARDAVDSIGASCAVAGCSNQRSLRTFRAYAIDSESMESIAISDITSSVRDPSQEAIREEYMEEGLMALQDETSTQTLSSLSGEKVCGSCRNVISSGCALHSELAPVGA